MQIDDRKAFIDFMNAEQPSRPANILNIVAINQGKRPLTMSEPKAKALKPAEVQKRIDDGLFVIDTRSSSSFGAGHIPNAYNIQLESGDFEQRVGWVTPLDEPFILVADNDSSIATAMHKLAFLGLDGRVVGYLQGGMDAWLKAGLPTVALSQITVQHLHETLQTHPDAINVLDVRETSEWDDGHIAGANYMNFKQLNEKYLRLGLSPEEPLAILCATGQRSSIAGSMLQRHGFENVYNVTGGMTAWAAAGLPMLSN